MDKDTGLQMYLIFFMTYFPKRLCSKPVACSVLCVVSEFIHLEDSVVISLY